VLTSRYVKISRIVFRFSVTVNYKIMSEQQLIKYYPKGSADGLPDSPDRLEQVFREEDAVLALLERIGCPEQEADAVLEIVRGLCIKVEFFQDWLVAMRSVGE
jgi:hypothetical protein